MKPEELEKRVVKLEQTLHKLIGRLQQKLAEREMPDRHVVSMAVGDEEVHVLCRDGTMWLRRKGDGCWQRLPDVPAQEQQP